MLYAIIHFILIYVLELKVKSFTIHMEAGINANRSASNRMILFLVILTFVLTPPLILFLCHPRLEPSMLGLVKYLTISSALFGIYFCVCKLYPRSLVHRFYAITVPASTSLTRMFSILGILVIGFSFISGLLYFQS